MRLTSKQKEARRILNGPANRILLYGGSRSGKTLIIIRNMFIRALKKSSRHVIFRDHFNHAKVSLWHDTIPRLINLEFKNVGIGENKQDWFYYLPNGSTIWLAGLDEKERTEKILGNEYSTIFFNEISQIKYDSILLARTRLAENSGLVNKIYFDCNPPASTHWSYKMFIKHIDPVTNQPLNEGKYQSLKMNPEDNIENLPTGYIEETLDTLPERQRRRFRLGEFVDDIEGALWNMELLDQNRVNERPELKRIVVAVDPAVTANPESDETGIVVCGIDADDHGYVLEDLSGIYTPDKWAQRVVYAYEKHEASKVIAEVNQGGDLVESNIRTIARNISYKSVRAFKGKYLRAEPVAALYEQGKIHHVGTFSNLEDELTTWDATTGQRSPNRLDALVYGITELMLIKKRPVIYVG